jgi:hypothetical protein
MTDPSHLERQLRAMPGLGGRWQLFDTAVKARGRGLVLEFGVGSGTSIRRLARLCSGIEIYGFDSFEGLPEQWHGGGFVVERGGFACSIPNVPENVDLVTGLFEDTLEPFFEHMHDHLGYWPRVGFAHIDCDIYSSTKTVLAALTNRVLPGSVLLFDELMEFRDGEPRQQYTEWRKHEWKALTEWLEATGYTIEILGRDREYRAAFRILSTTQEGDHVGQGREGSGSST